LISNDFNDHTPPQGMSIKVSNFCLKNLNFSLGVYYHYLFCLQTPRMNMKPVIETNGNEGKQQKNPIRQRQFLTPIWTIIFSPLNHYCCVFVFFFAFDYFLSRHKQYKVSPLFVLQTFQFIFHKNY
jgi:hypothetical protein